MRKYKKVASYVLTMILASSLAGMPVKAMESQHNKGMKLQYM